MLQVSEQANRRAGLTLVEVVIAISILAIGVLGAFALQTSALQGTRVAITAQDLANIARSEIQIQSQFRRTTDEPIPGESCRARNLGVDEAYTCSIVVYPCSGTANSLTCTNATVNTDVAAHQIIVTVTAADGRFVRLTKVVKAT